MKILTNNFRVDVGKKLSLVRKERDLTRSEMAERLGLNKTSYYKNEVGYSLPGLDTMYRLHMDFDISIDWLLFDSPPMHNKEKQPAAELRENGQVLEEMQPDVKNLLDAMEQDHILLYEVMLYFYKYKQNQETRETAHPIPLVS